MLVVSLGYTNTFLRAEHWHNLARYEVNEGLVCGFRLDAEQEGELDFVLYFGTNVGQPIRTLFQGLFENFLARRNLTVFRFEPVACPKCGAALERAVVRAKLREGRSFTFCNDCGKKLQLPKKDEPIMLTSQEQTEVEKQRHVADLRSRFEQALLRVQTYVEEQGIEQPDCFISYAWGEEEHERWVERQLTTDLSNAGIKVVLDRWDNQRIGASVSRFVERVAKCDRIVVVGTPLYQHKYDNKEPMGAYVVAAEGDLIGKRMIGTEAKKKSVLPVLLEGTEESSFPPLLQGRVYADFRDEDAYFTTAFDLILSLYEIPPSHRAVADLRESLESTYR